MGAAAVDAAGWLDAPDQGSFVATGAGASATQGSFCRGRGAAAAACPLQGSFWADVGCWLFPKSSNKVSCDDGFPVGDWNGKMERN